MREDYDQEFWDRYSVARPEQPLRLVDRFEQFINRNPPEVDIQNYLQNNPWLLSEQFPHCYHILPRFSLSGQYVTDFIAPERSSGGTFWMLIEIERPDCKLVTKDGEFAVTVRRAVRQVRDWKTWLKDNQDVARKSRLSGGLGLHDMTRMLCGHVIVGRRSNVTNRFNQLRNELFENEVIEVYTYDRIIDWARRRANYWES